MDGEIYLERQENKDKSKQIKIKFKLKLIKLLVGIRKKWKCLDKNLHKQQEKINSMKIISN